MSTAFETALKQTQRCERPHGVLCLTHDGVQGGKVLACAVCRPVLQSLLQESLPTVAQSAAPVGPPIELFCTPVGTFQEAPGTVSRMERDAELGLTRTKTIQLGSDTLIAIAYQLDGGVRREVTREHTIMEGKIIMAELHSELLRNPYTARVLAERARRRGGSPS